MVNRFKDLRLDGLIVLVIYMLLDHSTGELSLKIGKD